MSPVYQLFTIGWKGDAIFIGTFSTLDAAMERVEKMHMCTRTWVELDQLDDPVDEHNIVWEIPGTYRRKKSSDII
jgi:hypothetical protein